MATALTFVVVVAGVLWFASTATKPTMAVLYADLDTSTAAAVTEQLRDSGFAYELTDRGSTVRVPQGDLYEARLEVERADINVDDSSEFDVLDGLGITSTQFQQRVAYQRGLSSELETMLEAMSNIDEAGVTLVIPDKDLFTDDAVRSSASVMLTTSSRLSQTQVSSVVALVSGAVEGLVPEQVNVTDQDGNVLYADGMSLGGQPSDLDRTTSFEQEVASEIVGLVEAAAGPGNVRAAVTAVVDWSATAEVSESFIPVTDADGVQLKEAESVTVDAQDADTAQGILGAGDVAVLDAAGTVSGTMDADYLVDRVVRTTEDNGGDVLSMSASVVVDAASVTEEDLEVIEQLIATATGLSVDDATLSVAALEFDRSAAELAAEMALEAEAAAEEAAVFEAAAAQLRLIVIAGLAFLALMFGMLSLRRARKTMLDDTPVKRLEDILSGRLSILPVEEAPKQLTDTSKMAPGERLATVSTEQPQEVAELIRGWVSDNGRDR